AKALGIPMGAPYFKNKALIRGRDIRVFSSNYALYGDLSHRVMSVLRELEPHVEVYSIDEAFISMPAGSRKDLSRYARELKEKVEKWVGIPISVGIGPTKTLAKIANRFAKKEPGHGGAFVIDDHNRDALLASVEVGAVWGIGGRSVDKLKSLGIHTARQLQEADDNRLRKQLSVTGLRTAMELRSIPCIPLESAEPDRKSVISSRSFGRPVSSLADLREAIASHVAIGAAKLRQEGTAAGAIQVFILTNRFKESDRQYSGSTTIPLTTASACTPTLISAALRGLERIYRQGYRFNKAGIMLTGLAPRHKVQRSLLDRGDGEGLALMESVDRINRVWGRNTIRFAAEGLTKSWRMQQSWKSPAHTTSWLEIPVVNAGFPEADWS
ncbi:MAG: Y-family DNA polymerase, partial [Desulfurivibrionaceae bacterium]